MIPVEGEKYLRAQEIDDIPKSDSSDEGDGNKFQRMNLMMVIGT